MGPQSISSISFGKIPFFPACTRVYEVFWSVLIVFKICSGMDIKSSPPRSALKLVLKGTSFTWARMQHTSSVKHLSLLVCPSRDVIRWISGSSLMWRLHICRRLYWEIYLPIQSPSKKLFKAGSPLPPCVHGSGVSWEEWQGSSRVVLLQDIQEPLGHLQCSAGRSEDDGASGVKWVRFLCYCLVFLVLWSFIFDIGYLRIFAIAQKSEDPTDPLSVLHGYLSWQRPAPRSNLLWSGYLFGWLLSKWAPQSGETLSPDRQRMTVRSQTDSENIFLFWHWLCPTIN